MTLEQGTHVIVTFLATLGASSGFWAYLQWRGSSRSVNTKLLMGLAYDRLSHIGMRHIKRGWLTRDEYEDFRRYLYDPYQQLGGNGSASRIMSEIDKLPLHPPLSAMPVDIIKEDDNAEHDV